MKKSIGASERFFPNPVFVIGTYDAKGEPNAMTAAWGGVASSGPTSLAIAVRPTRYSFEAIKRTQAFTANLPTVEQAAAADLFGIASGRKINKFQATGMTPVRATLVDAPYIEELPYNMECKVTKEIDLGAHTLFIGEVLDVHVSEEFLDEDGIFDPIKAQILTFDPMRKQYLAPGAVIGPAFDIGKKYISR
jgi:flavin reductase (DIM6/NTAB) family NADH-FMN oxidoreductase RutF